MTEGIIIAVIAAIATIVAALVKQKSKGKEHAFSQNQSQNVTVNNFLESKNDLLSNEQKGSADTSNLKLQLQILFIDDEKFKMIDNIKNTKTKI